MVLFGFINISVIHYYKWLFIYLLFNNLLLFNYLLFLLLVTIVFDNFILNINFLIC